jgi:hypothetical protein
MGCLGTWLKKEISRRNGMREDGGCARAARISRYCKSPIAATLCIVGVHMRML